LPYFLECKRLDTERRKHAVTVRRIKGLAGRVPFQFESFASPSAFKNSEAGIQLDDWAAEGDVEDDDEYDV